MAPQKSPSSPRVVDSPNESVEARSRCLDPIRHHLSSIFLLTKLDTFLEQCTRPHRGRMAAAMEVPTVAVAAVAVLLVLVLAIKVGWVNQPLPVCQAHSIPHTLH